MIFENINIEVIRWIFIVLLLPYGTLLILVNLLALLYYLVTHKSPGSVVPIVGSVFCAIGIALLPYREISRYWYIPFLLDYTWIFVVQFLLFHRQWDREYRAKHPSQSDYRNDDNGVDDPSLTPSLPPNVDIPTALAPATIIVNGGGQ